MELTANELATIVNGVVEGNGNEKIILPRLKKRQKVASHSWQIPNIRNISTKQKHLQY